MARNSFNNYATTGICGTSGYCTSASLYMPSVGQLQQVWSDGVGGSLYRSNGGNINTSNPACKRKTFIEKLEEEMNGWHGNILEEMKETYG